MKYNFHKNSFEDHELFPDKIAIAGSDNDISWRELEQQCTQLSNIFNTLQIPKGHPIIIYGHKEAFFPVAMLACMHADIPYIPIDKIYPIERVKKIAENTKAQILINCSKDTLAIEFAVTINASLEVMQNYAPDYQNKVYGNSSDPLRYIMFTSGSTG